MHCARNGATFTTKKNSAYCTTFCLRVRRREYRVQRAEYRGQITEYRVQIIEYRVQIIDKVKGERGVPVFTFHLSVCNIPLRPAGSSPYLRGTKWMDT